MNPVHLHIGLTKTGTSSLQRFLSNERSMLAARGILYPVSGRGRHGTAHHNLFYEISEDQGGHGEFDAALGGWDSVLAEIEEIEGRTAIISSEAFQYCTPRDVEQLANLLGPRPSTMVAYVRRQDQWLESAWNQRARFGRVSLDFREFCETQGRVLGDYARTLSPWIDIFGDRRFDIRVFDRIAEKPGIAADFLAAYVPGGHHPVASRTDVRKNAKAGVKQLVAVDQILYACRAQLGDDFVLPRRSAARISEYFRGRKDRYDYRVLSFDDAVAIREVFRRSNEELARISTSFRESGPFPALQEHEFDAFIDLSNIGTDVFDEEERRFVDRMAREIVKASTLS
ncbi:hypothetical protein [Thioalkalivibrio sp.]|uniref:hypothetical protein n=1 Tax=Thioalkalivibrio sp. TaxID=2093813 RepID=UPI0012D6BF1A|nr:hypothetical protein [Thioalkalivibrio sp.]TVP82134.1 MAG: hypothetical protein EA346_03410 [Thioalkalivibrio sp.]